MSRIRVTHKSPNKVLVVDTSPLVRPLIVKELARRFEVVSAASYRSARELLNNHTDLAAVVCDWYLGGPETGLDLLAEMHWALPKTARVLASASLSAEMAEEPLRTGIIDAFVIKPCRPGEILAAVLGILHAPSARWPRADSPPLCA